MRRKLGWTVVGLVVLAAGAGGTSLWRSARTEGGEVVGSSRVSNAVPRTSTAESARPEISGATSGGWEVGTLYRYEMKSEHAATMSGGSGIVSVPGMRIRLAGDWQVGVAGVKADEIMLRISFVPKEFSFVVDRQGSLPSETRVAVEAGLRTPFFVSQDAAGKVALLHFERGVSDIASGLLRGVIGASQFVHGRSTDATWEAHELDGVGKYVAVYTRVQGGRIEKKKSSYLSLVSSKGLEVDHGEAHVELRGGATFELTESQRIRELDVSEEMGRDLGSGLPRSLEKVQLSLRLVGVQRDALLVGSFEARKGALRTQSIASIPETQADPMTHYRQALGGAQFADIVSTLRSLPKEEPARSKARAQAVYQLHALFKLDPEAAKGAVPVLRSGLESTAASPIIGGLSAASTPEAVRALAETVTDTRLPVDMRTDAVAALGVAEHPTSEGVDALRKVWRGESSPLRETAALGLGNAAMNRAKTDASGAEEMVGELKRAYYAAASDEERSLVLRALGNTRSLSAMSVLLEALGAQSAELRGSAVFALRNMDSPIADEAVVRVLMADPHPDVRSSAVVACSYRPISAVLDGLRRALQVERLVGVRMDIVQLLARFRLDSAAVDPILAAAAAGDSSAEVRNAASQALRADVRRAGQTP